MKASARAYSNIALVKYWGKQNDGLRLPMNASLSIGLDAIFTQTTVEFQENLAKDLIEIDGDQFDEQETQRVTNHLDLIRDLAKITTRARVGTKNNFPKAVGAASSASGFAALTKAAVGALGLDLSDKELSILARQGSGSAARSISGGFCVWHTGKISEDSFAERIEHPSDWDLRVLLVFVDELKQKEIGSTEGMALTVKNNPYYAESVRQAENNIGLAKQAIEANDFPALGKVIEDECYRLHAMCMTTTPNILYWTGSTIDVFQAIYRLRKEGVRAYFTVDAGPHVHVITQARDLERVKQKLQQLSNIHSIVECGVGEAATLIEDHLF